MYKFIDKETRLKCKQILKGLASELKVAKSKRTPSNRSKEDESTNWDCEVLNLRYDYRHKHIAYCIMLGRTMEEIEQPREGNEASVHSIELWLNKYGEPRTE